MKTINQSHVPHNTGWSAEMKQGQVIRITATTTVDFVFFNLHNLRERFDQARTKVYNIRSSSAPATNSWDGTTSI
jgi:uncharacterized protein YcgI (DUF1989 family)